MKSQAKLNTENWFTIVLWLSYPNEQYVGKRV